MPDPRGGDQIRLICLIGLTRPSFAGRHSRLIRDTTTDRMVEHRKLDHSG